MKLPVFNKVHLVLPCCPISGIFCRHRLYLRLAASRAQASVKKPSMQKTQTEARFLSISLRYSVLAMPSTEFSFPPMLRGSCLFIRLRLARSSHAAVTTTRLKSESADVAWKNCREDHFESCRLRSSVTEKKGRREAL